MPTKRRVRKSRDLTDLKIQELWYGPGSCLLAGGGYWRGAFFWELDPSEQADVVAEMREDWQRHDERVLHAWNNRDEHQLYIWREHHTDQHRPWAEIEFGRCQ